MDQSLLGGQQEGHFFLYFVFKGVITQDATQRGLPISDVSPEVPSN